MKVELPERFVAMDKSQKPSRRLRKVAVEKKRRERIDGCLSQIKDLLCKDSKQQNDNIKIERAELLENVLQYIRHSQESQLSQQTKVSQTNTSTSNDAEYREGFEQCMREANQMVEKLCRNKSSDNVKQYMQSRLSQLYVKSKACQSSVKSVYRNHNPDIIFNQSRNISSTNNLDSRIVKPVCKAKKELNFGSPQRKSGFHSLQFHIQKYRDIYCSYIVGSSSCNNYKSVANSSFNASKDILSPKTNTTMDATPDSPSSDGGYNTGVDSTDMDLNNNVIEPVANYKNVQFKLDRTRSAVNVWRPW